MTLRGLRLAAQFLTRLPIPSVSDFSPLELSRSAAWFPVVGAVIGVLVALIVLTCQHRSPLLGAALGVVAWVWLTGALHLDGLADLADALAASHRDPERFLTVLADPRVGTFGVVSIVAVMILKLAALVPLSERALLAFPLIPAWARLGPLAWSRWLKPLKPGQGERFGWQLDRRWIVFWTVALLAASALTAPFICVAPLMIAAWGVWLHKRLGGVTGDCLGAGVEVTETGLSIVLALTSGVTAGLL